MKPEEQLSLRYADLLTDPSDDALDTLVQELDTAYTAPERPAGLSWATASQRLALIPKPTLNTETRPRVRPLRLRAQPGRAKALLAFAAIIVVAFLSAALLATIGASWFQQSHQTQTFPETSSSFSAVDVPLLQQLLQSNETPANIRQLAQSGQFTKVDLTANTGNVTIQEVYADANNVVLVYTVDRSTWHTAHACIFMSKQWQCPSGPLLTVTTSDQQTLTQNAERVNFGPEPVYQNQRYAVLAYYDASSIQGNPKQLHVTVSLAKKVSPSQEKIGEFTVPFHADKAVIAINQTATSHGDALTLERVVITPTEIRFYNTGLSSSRLGGSVLYPIKLSIAGKSYEANPFPADLGHPYTYGWFEPGSSNFVSFYVSLQRQTGTWMLTEWASFWNGISFDHADTWTFSFTVSSV